MVRNLPEAAPNAARAGAGNESLWRRGLRRFLRNKMATVSLVILILLALASILAPYLTPHDPQKISILNRAQPPSAQHWLGTDEVGRDVLTRLLYGGRVSLAVSVAAAVLSVTIGIILGGIAGYSGGWLDSLIMRFTDGMLSIPLFFFMLVSMAVFGSGLIQIVIVIGVTTWMPIARIVRGEILRTKRLPFTEAASALGARPSHIITRHLLPQSIPSVIVAATLGIANAILLESALSYLGLGIQPPLPSWGNMLQGAQNYIWMQPMLAFWPGLLIFTAVMAYNALGDGIRDALDPTER